MSSGHCGHCPGGPFSGCQRHQRGPRHSSGLGRRCSEVRRLLRSLSADSVVASCNPSNRIQPLLSRAHVLAVQRLLFPGDGRAGPLGLRPGCTLNITGDPADLPTLNELIGRAPPAGAPLGMSAWGGALVHRSSLNLPSWASEIIRRAAAWGQASNAPGGR